MTDCELEESDDTTGIPNSRNPRTAAEITLHRSRVNPPALKCSAPRSECSKLATFSSRALCTGNSTRASERFEPFGRVKDNKSRLKDGVLLVGRDSETGALVRYHAQPPDWPESEGPEEFAHWMRHWAQLNGSFITYHHGSCWRCKPRRGVLVKSSSG